MSAIKIDGYSNFGFFQTLTPQDLGTAAVEGTAIDVRNYQTATLVVNVGACTSAGAMSTDNRYQLMLEHGESDTEGSVYWSECYPSQMLHSVVGDHTAYSALNSGIFQSIASTTDASALYYVGYRGPKRWIRCRISQVGAPSVFSVSAEVVCGLPNNWPVNDPVN
jgi:hypothetical protein